MEEGEATMGIGMGYNYILDAAMALIERQRYFDECLRSYQKKQNK